MQYRYISECRFAARVRYWSGIEGEGVDMESQTARRRSARSAPFLLATAIVASLVTSLTWVGAAPVLAASSRAVNANTKKVAHRCFGLYPNESDYGSRYIQYADGCYGHDEPDLAPISAVANTSQNITWTIVLPADGTGVGARAVVDVGPTFWFGAAVRDLKSLFGQAFEELQFYPDSTLSAPFCSPNGNYSTTSTPNKYTVCSPVWAVDPSTYAEYAAFNRMLVRSGTTQPLVMNAGDTVTVHYAKGTQTGSPLNITVADVTTGQQSAVLVLSGGVDGPLSPLSGTNTTSNNLQWGATQQAPLSLSWEIGHPNGYTYPAAPACYPGMFNCYSYNVTQGWQHTAPLKVKSVKFNNNTVTPTSWTVVDGEGGSQQDITYCGKYNAPGSAGSCTFPWYSYNGTAAAIEFGGVSAGVTQQYGAFNQFRKAQTCAGLFGPNTLYCATTLSPTPPIP